jgi:hypothetical protein
MTTPEPNEVAEEEYEDERPSHFWRIFAILLLLPYAILGWLRFADGLSYSAYMSGIKLWPGPRYIIASGLVVGAGFSLVLLFLISRARFSAPLTRIWCMLFLGWLWVDHIWLGRREAFRYQWIINLLISIVTILIAFVLVRDQDYLREKKHGQQ